MSGRGCVFWLFGLSGAGKSTLAGLLARSLREPSGPAALMLDGDRLRAGLCEGLGFSEADRSENLRRAAHVARLGIESGLVVIAAFITPLEEQRRAISAIIGAERISFIYVDAALEVCLRRDLKGLYARAAAGIVGQMTGVSARFEPPGSVDLQLQSDRESPAESAARLTAFARERLAALPGS